MSQLEALKEAAADRVAHLLPNDTFRRFDDLNTRMLVAVTCLRAGDRDLAYDLFASIAAKGPQENENRHFAYVRSLAEMAEIDAERERFREAEQHMAEALAQYPESMGYMMSRIHLEVYLTYYRFRLGKKEEARRELEAIIRREEERFRQYAPEDGRNLVGPGLCYAIHQLALFCADEGEWDQAVETFRRLQPYASQVDEKGWEAAEEMAGKARWKEAFQQMVESVVYEAP